MKSYRRDKWKRLTLEVAGAERRIRKSEITELAGKGGVVRRNMFSGSRQ